jgi:hypothetical protein
MTVHERINAPDSNWPDKPEMVVVRVDEHELGWVVFYTSRAYHETVIPASPSRGTPPISCPLKTEHCLKPGTAPPFDARLRAVELKLRAHQHGWSAHGV